MLLSTLMLFGTWRALQLPDVKPVPDSDSLLLPWFLSLSGSARFILHFFPRSWLTFFCCGWSHTDTLNIFLSKYMQVSLLFQCSHPDAEYLYPRPADYLRTKNLDFCKNWLLMKVPSVFFPFLPLQTVPIRCCFNPCPSAPRGRRTHSMGLGAIGPQASSTPSPRRESGTTSQTVNTGSNSTWERRRG